MADYRKSPIEFSAEDLNQELIARVLIVLMDGVLNLKTGMEPLNRIL